MCHWTTQTFEANHYTPHNYVILRVDINFFLVISACFSKHHVLSARDFDKQVTSKTTAKDQCQSKSYYLEFEYLI